MIYTLVITLRAKLSGKVYCYRCCLFVCGCVCGSVTTASMQCLRLSERLFLLCSGFLRQPWIQVQPWKVLKFPKTEKVLELFWKTSGRSWKVWNLPMWNFHQDLVTVRTSCQIVAIKRVEELLRLLIINKRHAWMLQIGMFFLKYQQDCML